MNMTLHREVSTTRPFDPPLQPESGDEVFLWEDPNVKAHIVRLREEGVQASQSAKSELDRWRVKAYYSEEAMMHRVQLKSHPQVIEALETIWRAADVDGSAWIDRSEYMTLHRKITLALQPSTPPVPTWQGLKQSLLLF